MHHLPKSEWFDRFRNYLDAFRFNETQVEFAASSMWESGSVLLPEEAGECYLEMMVQSGLLERRTKWRPTLKG